MSRPRITVWSASDSPRLRYVLDWLLTRQLGLDYELTDNADALANNYCLAYGYQPGMPSIACGGLLRETDIRAQAVSGGSWNGLYTLFHAPDSPCTIPFDLLSGIFYLLSRYEEYTDHVADRHGRYAHTNSILSRDGVLDRPVVDEWVAYLRRLLAQHWSLKLEAPQFRFLPSYDIDIAWSYRHKGWKRFAGAALKELLTGKFSQLGERLQVAAGRPDPYDAFDWMQERHRMHQLRPLYFILSARHVSAFDKNIPLKHPAMQALIRSLRAEGTIGIHPSYYTRNDAERLSGEIADCAAAAGIRLTRSRQHFIRVFFPDTYRQLLHAGIEDDYSMGYATSMGFRAGTSRTFPWYDLQRGSATALRIHPFCFMDTTARFDLELPVTEAFARLRRLRSNLQATGGTLTTVFHNFSLGTDPEWNGWREAYAAFLAETAEQL